MPDSEANAFHAFKDSHAKFENTKRLRLYQTILRPARHRLYPFVSILGAACFALGDAGV
jgi:hypothetical protein